MYNMQVGEEQITLINIFLYSTQMLQTNVVHYTSGFPILESSPTFDCTSQGPDPYESNYNLYEELDQYDEASDRSALSHNESFLDDPSTSAETTLVVNTQNNQMEPIPDPSRHKDCYMISKNLGPSALINSQSSYNHQIPRTNANFYAPPFLMRSPNRPHHHPATNGRNTFNTHSGDDSRFNTASRLNGNFSDFPRVFNNPRQQRGENEMTNSNSQHQRPNRVERLSSFLSKLRRKWISLTKKKLLKLFKVSTSDSSNIFRMEFFPGRNYAG